MSDPGSNIRNQAAPELQAGAVVTALLLSPITEDYGALKEIFRRANWQLYYANHPSQALRCLRQHRMPVLICESSLAPSDWTELSDLLQQLDEPPLVVVVSREAGGESPNDARSRGAFDVLVRPFERDRVMHVIGLASLRWHERVAGRGSETAGI